MENTNPFHLLDVLSNHEVRERVDRHMAELYDLKADPGENRNLINDPAQVETIEQLRAELDRLITLHGDGKPDQMPIDQGIQSGLPEESIR